MKVSELIEALSDMPQNMPVHFWANGERQTIIEVRDVGDCVDLYEEEEKEEEETTYAEQAKSWIQNSPYVDIYVGQFTIRFKLSMDRDWGWVWEFMNWLLPKEYFDSPEDLYFENIYNTMTADTHDMEFIDELLEAVKNKPFNQGE